MQVIYGGIVASILDSAGWYAAAAQNEGVWTATSEFSVHLLQPVQKTDLEAEGWVVKSGKRLCITEMRARTSAGELVAVATGTYVVLEGISFRNNRV